MKTMLRPFSIMVYLYNTPVSAARDNHIGIRSEIIVIKTSVGQVPAGCEQQQGDFEHLLDC